ncbi:MAG TPA: threonine--tRNA ligase [Polyangiaceae bacterium]|nr:threonine--tRNA ligase [Polyangiaceae bacterium]
MSTQPARKTPGELLRERGQHAEDIVAVRSGGRVVDLHTPVEASAELTPIHASEPAGTQVLRHSAAHVMADAVQRLFPGTQVTIGPAIDSGFYYDFSRPDGKPFSDADLELIEAEMRKIIGAKKPFYREEVSREEAHKLFEGMGEKFKLEVLDAIPGNEAISLYRHGSPGRPEGTWVDLCEGPHVPTTGHIGAVKLLSVAGAYWRGDEHNPMLQRIYGTAFPDEKALKEHLRLLEEARARDHRKLGKELELMMFHEWAPGMPFLLPNGAGIYNRLVEFVRSLYFDYGYEEVVTPQVFDRRLFETSGHIPNFVDGLYYPTTLELMKEHAGKPLGPGPADHPALAFGLKPMNCPSHCLVFGQRRRSYRELPWRVADFGRLHRFERAGVIHGLARVRSFCQDDAHIFCTQEQIEEETAAFTRLLFEVYRAFDLTNVSVKLALRPEKRMGTDAEWDHAENALERVLVNAGVPFEKLAGEGAFYGPKLEFHVLDAIGRDWQLGTIQLDSQMPESFGLDYIGADGGAHRPVMLHRAVLGSLERFFAIYIEHVAGKFPVWLAPVQVALVTVSEKQAEYAERVRKELHAHGLRVTVDASSDKLGAKIRNARLMRHPYVAVIGEKEVEAGAVSVRSRDAGELGSLPVAAFAARVAAEAVPPKPGKAPAPVSQ